MAEFLHTMTYNHDGRTYDLGSGYGHIALAVDDLGASLAALAEQSIEPEREPYRVREGGSLPAESVRSRSRLAAGGQA